MRRRRMRWFVSSVFVSVKRLRTPNWASIRFSHEASVGVGTGWMRRRRIAPGSADGRGRCAGCQDHEEAPARVAGAQATEGLADLRDALPATEQARETVGMDIIEAQELFGPMGAPVGRPQPRRLAGAGPGHASDRPEFQEPPLVEAHYRRARRAAPVEASDAFFFRSKAGSVEVFQVRIRWAVSPSRRRSRRTHSSVTGGRSRRCRQYSAWPAWPCLLGLRARPTLFPAEA